MVRARWLEDAAPLSLRRLRPNSTGYAKAYASAASFALNAAPMVDMICAKTVNNWPMVIVAAACGRRVTSAICFTISLLTLWADKQLLLIGLETSIATTPRAVKPSDPAAASCSEVHGKPPHVTAFWIRLGLFVPFGTQGPRQYPGEYAPPNLEENLSECVARLRGGYPLHVFHRLAPSGLPPFKPDTIAPPNIHAALLTRRQGTVGSAPPRPIWYAARRFVRPSHQAVPGIRVGYRRVVAATGQSSAKLVPWT